MSRIYSMPAAQSRAHPLALVLGADASGAIDQRDDEFGVPEIHAPFPGLREACDRCGTLNVSGLGSGVRRCDSCSRLDASHYGETGMKAEGGGVVEKEVAVTSAREIGLGGNYARALAWTGSMMFGAATLLLLLLLVAWKGFRTSLISSFTPWILVYVPIPLGLLNGAWSFHCARAGHIKYQATGSCVSRAGLCGTAWGCSGPSCALNLGLDLGLFITALLAAVPAGAAPRGCGYTCVTFLCFPCAPVGGEGLAVFMVFAALALAVGAATKMWVMAKAMKERGVPGLRREEFLPW